MTKNFAFLQRTKSLLTRFWKEQFEAHFENKIISTFVHINGEKLISEIKLSQICWPDFWIIVPDFSLTVMFINQPVSVSALINVLIRLKGIY